MRRARAEVERRSGLRSSAREARHRAPGEHEHERDAAPRSPRRPRGGSAARASATCSGKTYSAFSPRRTYSADCFGVRRRAPTRPCPGLQPREVARGILRQPVRHRALRVPVACRTPPARAARCRPVVVVGVDLKEIAVDVGGRGGAGIGGIDDVHAAEADGRAEGGDVEVVVQQHPADAADLQDFALLGRVVRRTAAGRRRSG